MTVALSACRALSQVRVGIAFSSLQENRSSTQTQSVGRTFYDGHLSVGLNKESPFYLSVGYLSINSVESYDDSSTTKLASTAPYVGGEIHFWKKKTSSLLLGAFYSPFSKLTVTEGGAQETWEGDTVIGKVTGSFTLSEKFRLNAGIDYISETFAYRKSGSVTDKNNFNQSYFAPSLGIALAF